MNPIYNSDEKRLRSGFRILFFIILTIIFILPSNFIPFGWLTYLVIAVGTFLAAYIAAKFMDKRPISDIGLFFDVKWIKDFLVGAIIAFIAQSVIFLIEWQAGWLEITGFAWHQSQLPDWILPILSVLVQMLAVGFYEEVIFRGYTVKNLAEGFTMGTLNSKAGLLIAVIFTSVLFGLAHFSNPNADIISTINIVFAGFMLVLPFILTGRLGLSVGIHFAWNFVMGGVYGLPVSGMMLEGSLIKSAVNGPVAFTGGEFGPEAGISGVIGMALIILLVGVHHYKQHGGLRIHPTFLEKYADKEAPDNILDELA